MTGPRTSHTSEQNTPAGTRFYRLAIVGDGYVGPSLHARRGTSGLERWFVDDCFVNWLRVLLPEVDLPEGNIFGCPSATTVGLVDQLANILTLEPRPDVALICVGTEDCFASVRGTAPELDSSAEALGQVADRLAGSGIRPFFVIPPPSVMFVNGLFADRYIALAATLRRICRADKRFSLIDPTAGLLKPRAFGIEPDPRFAKPTDPGLTELGAFRLARHIAEHLQSALVFSSCVVDLDAPASLNANPRLWGDAGVIQGEGIMGECPDNYYIDSCELGGAQVNIVRAVEGRRTLRFSGTYRSDWAFARLCQLIEGDRLSSLSPGDTIEAYCDLQIDDASGNLAAICLNVTAVWETDYVALCSRGYAGGPGLKENYAGRLRTPIFRLPGRLKKLHVALQAHLELAKNKTIDSSVNVSTIVLRKLPSATIN